MPKSKKTVIMPAMKDYRKLFSLVIFCSLWLCFIKASLADSIQPSLQLKSKNDYILTQQQWTMPKRAESILKIPALLDVMDLYLKKDNQKIMIQYPGGEGGILWGSELKAWLVSLGVSSSQITLQSGHIKSDELKLIVMP